MKTRIGNLFLQAMLITGLGSQLTAQTFTTLYSFTASSGPYPSTNSDGCCPPGSLLLSGGTLYGTTASAGTGGKGTIFRVHTDGTGFTNLHNFAASSAPYPTSTNSDGAYAIGALNLSGNTLYGTARYGGAADRGTLFKINTDGTGFAVLHTFTGGSDGCCPNSRLIVSGNVLYGAGFGGGQGTIFKVNTDGTELTNLYYFPPSSTNSSGIYTNSDGAFPFGDLLLSGNKLYGSANTYGPSGHGTVFAVNTDGTGFTNLHSFSAGPGTWPNVTNSDGANPWAGLVLSGNTLYGTGNAGGSSGLGTVFKLNTDGTAFTTPHSFTATTSSYPHTNSDGASPQGGLILLGDTLYGTATYGGSSGNGTVFAIKTDGTGFTNMHSFTARVPLTNSDGANPWSGLILSGNTLYGTANSGGSSGNGTVFSIFIQPKLTIVSSGANVILTWPTNYPGFTLQSRTDLVSQAVWKPVSPAPVVINGQNTVTNSLLGTGQFYRLIE